jgi:hypothetical protein
MDLQRSRIALGAGFAKRILAGTIAQETRRAGRGRYGDQSPNFKKARSRDFVLPCAG